MGGRLEFLEATAFKREYYSCVFVDTIFVIFFFYSARTSRRFKEALQHERLYRLNETTASFLSRTLCFFRIHTYLVYVDICMLRICIHVLF